MQGRHFARLGFCALFLAFLLSSSLSRVLADDSLPKPTGYVNDFAHALQPADQIQLEQFCGRVERELGVQFALVTIDSLHGQPIEDYAIRLARKWGVGDKKTNQGVLLLLSIGDRQSDIETGRGIEAYLGDGFSGNILRSMRPQLRQANYGAALLAGAQAMASQIAEAKGIPFSDSALPSRPRHISEHEDDTGIPVWLIIAGIFFLLWLIGRGGRRGGRGGGVWTGLWLASMLNNNARARNWDRNNWGNGGGFGGDSGGGGFGGFGGGDFGGGGANSNW